MNNPLEKEFSEKYFEGNPITRENILKYYQEL